MIKKVVIGQGFRLAFPAELGGMPYLREEMEDAKPFDNKKPPVQKPQSKAKTSALTKDITTIGKITPKDGKRPWKILGEGDVIYSTYSDSFAALANSAMESGMKVEITHRGDAYNTLESIGIVDEDNA